MIYDVIEEKRNEFGGIIRKWWNKIGEDRQIKAKSQQERYIGILQKRYGYTKEKAISELNTHYSKIRFG
jgi:uncharacterized protein YjbJ (UPF0337 family)